MTISMPIPPNRYYIYVIIEKYANKTLPVFKGAGIYQAALWYFNSNLEKSALSGLFI
jgi:hypothetical protein